MNTKQIYFGTLKFVWMKLGLGIATILASITLLAFCTSLVILTRSSAASFVLSIVWVAGTVVLNQVITHYFGYLVKAGHIAIVAEAIKHGTLPEQQFKVARQLVQERFVTANVYFVIDRMVSGAVKQLQKRLGQFDTLFGGIPGVSIIVTFAKVFVSISLNYVDECCLGYTFYMNNQNVYKSAADGVVIYFQNWKKLLKHAAVLSLFIIGAVFVSWLLILTVFGGVFTMFHWSGMIAGLFSLIIAMIIKSAFIDSYIMVSTMISFLQAAPETEISFDLYDKLCTLSGQFKKLFEKGTSTAANTGMV